MMSYDPFWKTLKDKGVTQYELIKVHHISESQLTRLRKGQYISTHTVEIFCRILNCKVEDIIEYIPD